MKRQLLVLFLLFSITLFGQKKIAEQVLKLQKENTHFNKVSILTPTLSIDDTDVKKTVREATLAKADLVKINQVVTARNNYIELEIPYQNQLISVLLYKVNPFTEDFQIDTDKKRNIAYQKGVYYRGIIKNDMNSVSSFNFFNGEFNGIISSESLGNLVIGKLDKKENQLDYIVYSDTKMNILNDWNCHVKEDNIEIKNSTMNREVNTLKCVTFYFEIDYTLFVQNGNSTTTTINWMTSVFNNVQTLFTNDDITTALKSMFIWTSLDVYHGPNGLTSLDYLYSFAQNRPVFNGDVGMLIGIDGGLGGIAALNSICSTGNYAYSDVNLSFSSVPVYSWTVQVITHEFGHSLGSPHTHACVWNGNNTAIDNCGPYAIGQSGEGYSCMTTPPTIPSPSVKGTIMSYCHLTSSGISFANGFGSQPATLIRNRVNSKTCLSVNCINTCINTAANIRGINATETSAIIVWDDVGTDDVSWQVSVNRFGFAPGVWQNVGVVTSYTVSDLQSNTYYEFRIRPVCTGITPVIRTQIFATAGNYCGGMLFTDTGGEFGQHSNMENFIRTMIPNLPNQKLTATFTAFQLENNYDFLYIFDGPDETYPELNFGDGFTGTNSPGTITSTATDGSLTFKFISDEGTFDSGWIATISCSPSLGISNNDFIDFSYYPNPTNGNLNIKSNTSISEITVFNIEGRRLFNQTLDTLETSVDISQFATGTYFFKLKFGEKEANFKVLKM